MRKIALSVLLVSAGFLQAAAQEKHEWIKFIRPDFVQGQFAGSMGLVSAGAGYRFAHQRLEASLLDGYTPRRGAYRPINTLNLRLSYDLFRIKFGEGASLRPYAGATALFETSGYGYYATPPQYPDGYYYLSAFQQIIFVGGKVQLPVGSGDQLLGLYAETGTLGNYAYSTLMSGGRGFARTFTAAFGVKYYFASKRNR